MTRKFQANRTVRIGLCGAVLASRLFFDPGAAADEANGTAQASDTSEPKFQIDEIVVTAQKRSQKLSDVGATISVANAEQLLDAGITDVGQLARIVPGLTTAMTQLGVPVFSVRGVNFNAQQLSAPPSISVYLDEATLPFSFMTAGLLFDVDHVEVLKGPQGTLFGQNATGGSINVIAAKPTKEFSAGAIVEVNDFGQTMLESYVSGPLTDQLRVRLAGTTTQFGAWQEGYHLSDRDNGTQNKSAARLLVDWNPSDRLSVSLDINGNYDHGEVQQPQVALVNIQVPSNPPPGLPGYPLPTNDRQADFDADINTHARNDLGQIIGRVDYALTDDLKLTSITNYVVANYNEGHDIDGTAIPSAYYVGVGRDSTFSQELRLGGTPWGTKLHYLVGANYQNDDLRDGDIINLIDYSGFPPNAVDNALFKPKNRTVGAFGNLDYEISPGVTLTGGVRYTDIKQSITGCSVGNAPFTGVYGFIAGLLAPGVGSAYRVGQCININDTGATPTYLPTSTNRSIEEHNVSWRAGINYKPSPDSLIYGLASRAFKAGVFPVDGVVFESQESPVKQEQLTAYEVGAKTGLFDRRVTVNLAAFYYDYLDKQFNTFIPTPIGVVNAIINIPKSNVKGVDLELAATPIDRLELHLAATYVDTKIGNFSSYDNGGVLTQYAGTEFNYAPPLSATLGAEYRIPLTSKLEGFFGSDALYNDRTYADLGEVASTRIPTYTVVNARVGVKSLDGWQVSLWVRNLADKYYWNSVGPGGDAEFKYAGLPRMFGVRAEVKF